MFFRNLCRADARALETGLLDKLARKVSHGTLKGRACRREIERLFVASALREIVHLIQNRCRIAVLQLHGRTEHRPVRMLADILLSLVDY